MRRFTRMLAVLLALALLPCCVSAEGALRYEGDGFDTPEAAVTCYLEGLRDLDLDRMLGAFAWETQVEHFDIKAYYGRMHAYLPTMVPHLPDTDPFLRRLNLEQIRSQQITAIVYSLEAYVMGNDYPEMKNVLLREEEEIDAFLASYDLGRLQALSGMTDIRFLTPDMLTEGRFSEPRIRENFVKQTAHYGADDIVNVPAMADVGDLAVFCCPTVARYGDRWYLVSVGSVILNMLSIDMVHQAFIVFDPADYPF
ncbi:MAG: hypothetical protein IJK28_09515 [Clostridia bacterium]|nr:hypothetical protein [Clostridia bacterium]